MLCQFSFWQCKFSDMNTTLGITEQFGGLTKVFQPADTLFLLDWHAGGIDSALQSVCPMKLVSIPKLDSRQTQRQSLPRGHQAGMHQNPATGVKPRRSFFPSEKGVLAQYPDRCRVLVTIGELRRVMKDQNRGTAPRNEPLACRCKVTRQDIGFADSVVPEKSNAALVLAESWQAHGVAPPTLLDSCPSSCRSRLPWRTSGNSQPTSPSLPPTSSLNQVCINQGISPTRIWSGLEHD